MLALNLTNIVPGFLLWLREPVPLRGGAAEEPGLPARPDAAAPAAISLAREP